ncbi:MAG: hypothetical protein ACD_33C00015G0003 [uncultured bacterium]|nr:MAG: hypothetical protein ACD_33C00015G0003 [uncultured bacterium]
MENKTKQKKVNFKDLKNHLKDQNYHNYPNNFKKEGEDHVNISIFSDLHLGKVLSPEYNKIINYPHIGKFNSVLSLWFWIRDKNFNDNLRRLTGIKLKNYVKVNNIQGTFRPNFKSVIAHATWMKVKSYPHILEAIKALSPETKLLSYSVIRSSGLRLSTNYASIIIEIANEIIKAVKEDRDPDFMQFADDKDKAGLMYLENILSNICSPEKIEEMKNAKVEVIEIVEEVIEQEIIDDSSIEDIPDSTDEEEVIEQETITEILTIIEENNNDLDTEEVVPDNLESSNIYPETTNVMYIPV